MAWRSMRTDDLPNVIALAARAHLAFPERDEVFAERLALAPDFCLVHEVEVAVEDGGRTAFGGYVVAHPWTDGPPPALDTLLGALPAGADILHLHDCVIAESARGRGGARAGLAALVARAEGAYRAIGLVAVAGKETYWAAQGFRPVPAPQPSPALAGYGPDALPMRLLLPDRGGNAPPSARK